MITSARAVAAVVLVAATAAGATATASPVGASRVHPASATAVADAAYRRLTPAERIGQLFMIGSPSTGSTSHALLALEHRHVGNVILVGGSTGGQAAVATVTQKLRSGLTTRGVAPFISTDQEGGEVQRLTGRGFATMPSALKQGRLTPNVLRSRSAIWGAQLVKAGVTVDLAPVADTVPAKDAKANQPIGRYDREFGHTPAVVKTHVAAFVAGMRAAGEATTIKHFPGLGRATGNTDTSPHVTDPTTRHDRYLAPYAAGVAAGASFVMVSSATYPHIDPHHLACFSTVIIGSMLRGDIGFRGIVISDDLSTTALKRFSDATRATHFFAAGGTMLLDTSPNTAAAMIHAVAAKAAKTPAFAKLLKADELLVLKTKAAAGLIGV